VEQSVSSIPSLALDMGQVMQRLNAASWLLLALLARAAFPQGADRLMGELTSLQLGLECGTLNLAENMPDSYERLDDLAYAAFQFAGVQSQEPASSGPATAPQQESRNASPTAAAASPDQVIDPQVIEQARAGDAVAQYKLGYDYYLGRGIAQDYAQAAIWWKKAAEQGYPEAQNNLGVLYNSGRGIPQSYSEAYFWQNLAAARANGPLQAQFAKNRDESGGKLYVWERLRVQKRASKWAAEHPIQPKPAAEPTPYP
jgi:TPR repeat protein